MRFYLISLIILATPLIASAEPQRGRLPDGRAFRVDAAGNELVDYIAELEVANDAMKQRILGLEDEVSEKNAEIERLRKSGGIDSAIQEKSLELDAGKDHKAKFSKLNNENKELMLENEKLALALEDAIKIKSQLASSQAENAVLINEIAQLQQENTSVVVDGSARASLRPLGSNDLYELQKNIKELERLIKQRDADMQSYLSSGSSIGLSPSEAVSKRGMSLKAVKYRVKSPVSHSEALRLQQDLSEIRQLLKDDIALIERLENF